MKGMCRAVWLVFHDSLSDRLIKKQMFQFRARSDDGCRGERGEHMSDGDSTG